MELTEDQMYQILYARGKGKKPTKQQIAGFVNYCLDGENYKENSRLVAIRLSEFRLTPQQVKRITEFLVSFIRKNADGWDRNDAARLLGKLEQEKALIELLNDPNEKVAETASRGVKELVKRKKCPAIVEPLINVLKYNEHLKDTFKLMPYAIPQLIQATELTGDIPGGDYDLEKASGNACKALGEIAIGIDESSEIQRALIKVIQRNKSYSGSYATRALTIIAKEKGLDEQVFDDFVECFRRGEARWPFYRENGLRFNYGDLQFSQDQRERMYDAMLERNIREVTAIGKRYVIEFSNGTRGLEEERIIRVLRKHYSPDLCELARERILKVYRANKTMEPQNKISGKMREDGFLQSLQALTQRAHESIYEFDFDFGRTSKPKKHKPKTSEELRKRKIHELIQELKEANQGRKELAQKGDEDLFAFIDNTNLILAILQELDHLVYTISFEELFQGISEFAFDSDKEICEKVGKMIADKTNQDMSKEAIGMFLNLIEKFCKNEKFEAGGETVRKAGLDKLRFNDVEKKKYYKRGLMEIFAKYEGIRGWIAESLSHLGNDAKVFTGLYVDVNKFARVEEIEADILSFKEIEKIVKGIFTPEQMENFKLRACEHCYDLLKYTNKDQKLERVIGKFLDYLMDAPDQVKIHIVTNMIEETRGINNAIGADLDNLKRIREIIDGIKEQIPAELLNKIEGFYGKKYFNAIKENEEIVGYLRNGMENAKTIEQFRQSLSNLTEIANIPEEITNEEIMETLDRYVALAKKGSNAEKSSATNLYRRITEKLNKRTKFESTIPPRIPKPKRKPGKREGRRFFRIKRLS